MDNPSESLKEKDTLDFLSNSARLIPFLIDHIEIERKQEDNKKQKIHIFWDF